MMVGGEEAVVERLRPILEALAPASDKGWGRVGPSGAGHFVKMVHNGIEYGMMQAYAEGFELMQRKTGFGLDLGRIAGIWRHGSVVRSWLLDLTADALAKNPGLDGIAAYVPDSGEGRWTAIEAIETGSTSPSSRWPCKTASGPARKRLSGTNSWPRCATSSAGTRSRARSNGPHAPEGLPSRAGLVPRLVGDFGLTGPGCRVLIKTGRYLRAADAPE